MELFRILYLLFFASLALARSPQHVNKRLEGYRDINARAQEFQRQVFEAKQQPKPRAYSPYLSPKTQSEWCWSHETAMVLTLCRVCCKWLCSSGSLFRHWRIICRTATNFEYLWGQRAVLLVLPFAKPKCDR